MLKLPEVAQRLGVSEKTARRYIKAGTIPSVFIGNAYRVRVEDLDEYVRRAQVDPEGADAPKAVAPQPDHPDWARFDLERIIAMNMTEFAQYIATLDDDAVQRLRGQIDAEAARQHSAGSKTWERVATRSFVAGLDLQVRKQEATREQLNAIVAAV